MKRKILLLIILILLLSGCKNNGKLKGHITLSGAFALYPMAVKWAEEFKKTNPEIKIDISAGGAGKGMADALANMVDIGMVSREIYNEEISKGAFSIAVTKDAVVAVINKKNPLFDKIVKKGLTEKIFEEIWISEKIRYWEEITGGNNRTKINLYTRSDACGAGDTWAKYLGNKKQEDLKGIGVFGDPGIVEAVKNDPNGIGFSNIGYAYDIKSMKFNEGISVVPIDLNANGKIDDDENFYLDKNDLVKAIAGNKFPSPPAKVLYFVTHNKPKKKETLEFIKWILTTGQSFVDEAGYVKLSKEQLDNEIKKF